MAARIYSTKLQTPTDHNPRSSALEMCITCERVNWLNKQSYNQQGDMKRGSLVIKVFTAGDGLGIKTDG
jgi:hypothetical protein